MNNQPAELLATWLEQRLPDNQWQWLHSQIEKVLKANSERDLHITLGLIPRKLGREDLNLSEAELTDAESARNGWDPSTLSIDAAARILLLCRLAARDESGFEETLTDLCRSADLAELLAIYAGTPLYPHSETLDRQIGEGLRTNMRAVFEAIAHNNPYPAEHFDENRWNHMVLKALFIDSTLAPIQGLDERKNAELAIILLDYARERRAAGRAVTPELWRCMGGPFCTTDMIDTLSSTAQSDDPTERNAALLALSNCTDPVAQEICDRYPAISTAIAQGNLTWDTIESLALEQ